MMNIYLKFVKLKLIMPAVILFITSAWSPLTAGDYSASFLEIGVGARALGLGGAFCSLADDGTAFYWNPAGLAFLRRPQISGMYGLQFGSLKDPLGHYHQLGYVHILPGNAVIAINWIRLAVDDIPLYSELAGDSYWDRLHDSSLRPDGVPTGYMADTEDALYFSFAINNKWNMDLGWNFHKVAVEIPIGFNLKLFRQKLGQGEASGIGLDIGTMVRINLADFFQMKKLGIISIGLQIQDLTGSKMSWNTLHQDVIPVNFKTGTTYIHPVKIGGGSISISYNRDTRWGGRNRWGAEYKGFGLLALRLGLDNGKFAGGAGIKFWRLSVDYAFLSHELDSLHRLSCSLTL